MVTGSFSCKNGQFAPKLHPESMVYRTRCLDMRPGCFFASFLSPLRPPCGVGCAFGTGLEDEVAVGED